MMTSKYRYLAITQNTADWILAKSKVLGALKEQLNIICNSKGLLDGVLTVGPMRISAMDDKILCFWNTDYLSGTDNEEWGFIKIQSNLGLFAEDKIYGEVFERQLYVINQRLQGLLLADDRFIHRTNDNIHTCLAGRGESARKHSIGWYENRISVNNSISHSIVIIGPTAEERFESVFANQLPESITALPKLIEGANAVLKTSKAKPILEAALFSGLSESINDSIKIDKRTKIPVESIPELGVEEFNKESGYLTSTWNYDKWVSADSPLTATQRTILQSDILLNQPLRIIGSAGSGKSLLMQLLALRRLNEAKSKNIPTRVIYIVHNSEMENNIWKRFEVLGAEEYLTSATDQSIVVRTLFDHCRREMDLNINTIIDKDASQTKAFQREIIIQSIESSSEKQIEQIEKTPLLSRLFKKENSELMELLADLISVEIGVAIKGRGLKDNRKLYVESERPLTRFHGVLNPIERGIVYDIYLKYHAYVFDELEVLDSDDIAITFLAHLRTPLWEMKRKKNGFDFVFVDETQLFNQNERQLFRLLTKKSIGHLPIAIALDEAQELRGSLNTGFGLIGIDDMSSQTLATVHRSTPSILNLAFFVIQRTTDLFGTEFPDFTKNTTTIISDTHPLAKKPILIVNDETSSFAKSIIKEIKRLKKSNIRQIAVVIHAERYWSAILDSIQAQGDIQYFEGLRRGQSIDAQKPIVVITKPENVGGQEFDAVISVGLEYGVVPPIVNDHAGLSESLEQQSLREIYLAFTRARYQLLIINSKNSTPTKIIDLAIQSGLIDDKREKQT